MNRIVYISLCCFGINNQFVSYLITLITVLYSQMIQIDTGSFFKNIKLWAKDVWNIFDVVMYLLFLASVFLRCLLDSEQFFYARLIYAITLAMFILRSMHFFFVTRIIGPKVVMIGRMVSHNLYKHKSLLLSQLSPVGCV